MLKTYQLHAMDRDDGPLYYVVQTNSRKRFPLWEGYSKNKEEAKQILATVRKLEDDRQASMAEHRAVRKIQRQRNRQEILSQVKVGSVFGTCWGYEQTNREFYEVIDTYGRYGLVLREIAQKRVRGTGPFSAAVKFQRGHFVGPEIRRRLTETGVRIDDVRTAWLETDGEHHVSWGH